MKSEQFPQIAILATGNELILGDTDNSNGQYIARALVQNELHPGMQLLVGDEETAISSAIRFLLSQHAGLISIGGLGPTSDDRTRFALSKALNLPLVFNEIAWQDVLATFTQKNRIPEECAKQQALFPTDAIIFPNPNGTAPGCELKWRNKYIYLLPGPPRECLPIFDKHVLPSLIQHKFQRPLIRRSWMLYNVFESQIASQLDPLIGKYKCELGYYLHYPHLEIRVWGTDPEECEHFSKEIMPIIQPYLKR